jgi:hypothetical protein
MMNGKFGNLGVEIDKPSRMPIVLPGEIDALVDENGAEAYIEFLPWDSEPGRKFDQEQQREQVRKGFRQRSRADLRAEAENVDLIKDQADRLVVLATGWHLVDTDRAPIDTPFSKANALELFMAPKLGWLRRQAWLYVSNETNFMQRSSKNSSTSPSTNSSSTGAAEPAAPNANT